MQVPLEMSFRLRGRTLPYDNGYPLYAALSAALGEHLPEGVGVIPVSSSIKAGDTLVFTEAFLRIRTPQEHISYLLQLSGKQIEVQGHSCIISTPNIYPVPTSDNLFSPFVTIKNFMEENTFLEAVQRKLKCLNVKAKASIPLNKRGLPQRKYRTIRDKKIIGFGLNLSGLSQEHANILLNVGIGGRRHMGAGIFSPCRSD